MQPLHPEVDQGQAEADIRQGVLTVKPTKTAQNVMKAKKIQVRNI